MMCCLTIKNPLNSIINQNLIAFKFANNKCVFIIKKSLVNTIFPEVLRAEVVLLIYVCVVSCFVNVYVSTMSNVYF